MMIESPTELEEIKTNDQRDFGTQAKSALLSGIVLSITVVLVWFLLSKSAKSVGEIILISTISLLALDTFVLVMLKRARKLLKISSIAVLVLLNVVVFLSVTVYSLAGSQMFHPHFDEESYSELKTRAGTEELTVETENGTISGWMLHNAENSAPLLLYFCGNGENASTRMLRICDNDLLKTFTGYNLAIFDYPGYGKTDGHPSEETLKDFGLAAFDALAQRNDVDKNKIVVFGYSIGTGVADYVASKRDVSGLILMAPYADGYDLYNEFFDIFHGPLRLLVSFRMESIKFAEDVSVIPLILASKSDEMVSYNSSVRLSNVFSSGCTLKTLENTGHNEFWGSESVINYIAEYLAEVNAR